MIRMASRRDHGRKRKTRSSWTTYKSMVMEAGEHCPRMQVNGPSSSSFLFQKYALLTYQIFDFFERKLSGLRVGFGVYGYMGLSSLS